VLRKLFLFFVDPALALALTIFPHIRTGTGMFAKNQCFPGFLKMAMFLFKDKNDHQKALK
jgi:hypothetical protein